VHMQELVLRQRVRQPLAGPALSIRPSAYLAGID
jgi:hypothetical protein